MHNDIKMIYFYPLTDDLVSVILKALMAMFTQIKDGKENKILDREVDRSKFLKI